jgi:GPH family glycoside/pentoside/hexuronide:cation symporter
MNSQFDSHEAHVIVSPLRKLAYGFSGMGTGMGDYLVATFIMIYYPVILHMNPATIGLVLIVPRMWDAITCPLMGQISDRTRTRWGRRRPYILFGAPLLSLATFLMFAPPRWLSERGMAWYVLVVGMLYYTAYTVVIVPSTALGVELSVDYHERTRIQVWRSVLASICGFITPWTWKLSQLGIFPDERTGVMWIAATYAIISMLSNWVTFTFCREESGVLESPTLPLWHAFRVTFRNRAFMMLGMACFLLLLGLWGGFSLMQYVTIYYVYGGTDHSSSATLTGLTSITFALIGLLSSFFWGWAGIKFDKRKGFILGILSIACMAPMSWFLFTPTYPYLQLVYQGILGFTCGALQIFPGTMMADVCDVDEYQTGCRREGAYNGIMTFLYTAGFAGTFFVTGILLRLSGFDENIDAQAPETLMRMRLFLAFVPFAVMLLIALAIWFYPLREKDVRAIRVVLDQRREERMATAGAQPESA